MRLAVYLHTPGNSQPPWELVKYRMRMMYQITPKEFHENKGRYLVEMMQDMKCRAMESKVQTMRQK